MIHPITVCAPPTSGKVVLTALLEGHPDIFSFTSWHDNIAPGLGYFSFTPEEDFWERDFVLRRLRNIQLVLWRCTDWAMLEYFARRKSVSYSVAFSKILYLPFDFDFYDFTRDVVDGFVAHEQLDARMIFSIIFTALFQRMYPGAALPRYAVSEGIASFYRFPLLAELYPEGRIIYIARDIEAAYYSTLSRWALMAGRSFTEQLQAVLRITYRVDKIKRCYQADAAAKAMAAERPDMVFLITFEELILNTESVMRKLCAWLGVEYLPCLRQATWFGKLIDPAVIGVIHDDFTSFSRTPDAVLLKDAFASLRDEALLEGHLI